jgi:hypothetical protein
MGLFGNPTRAERDQNAVVALERSVQELRRELEGAQRRIDAVDLHARAIVEECKRLINKFERRLDRETPPTEPGKGPQKAVGATNGADPYLGPSRRNY